MIPTLKRPVHDRDHRRGPPHAAVVLVEYVDFECPTCAQGSPEIARLVEDFSPRISWIVRHFPLSDIHPNAFAAAKAAEAADQQGQFWPMHDLLFENSTKLSEQGVFDLAETLGLDSEVFGEDYERKDLLKRIGEDYRGGQASGIDGTPALFLNGRRLFVRPDYESLRQEILRVESSAA